MPGNEVSFVMFPVLASGVGKEGPSCSGLFYMVSILMLSTTQKAQKSITQLNTTSVFKSGDTF